MRKQRRIETDEQRDERNKRTAKTKIQEAKDADRAVDSAIRRNIKLYGP